MIVCKNCGTHFKGKHCPQCAQKASTGRLRLTNVTEELWHNFTHTDKTAVGLVVDLIKKPGVVIREYINLKRKKYFNPYTFFLVSSGLLIFLLMHVFKYEDKLYKFYNEFGQYTSKNYTLIIICSLPFLAGICKLIFYKRDINYAEWIVFFIFSYCIINTVQIVIQLLYFPLIRFHRYTLGYTEALTYLILFVVMVRFIRPKRLSAILQCVVAIIAIFFFVELFAKLFTLWVFYGVPLKVLLNGFSLF